MTALSGSDVVRRAVVPACGLAALAVFTVLYLGDADAYQAVMTALIKVPAPRPFTDWEWIPSAVTCWGKGVNVYVNNTCYKMWPDLAFNYSPLWLRASFLPDSQAATNVVSLSLTVLFFLSLGTLPPPRSRLALATTLLASLSSAVALAVERANADLLMFLMAIAGSHLTVLALPFRLGGYALFTLAGLLKFYPFVALTVALRERPAVVAAVALAAGAALTALVIGFHGELALMARNLPIPSYFTLQFAAADLGGGLGTAVAKVAARVFHLDRSSAGTVGAVVAGGVRLLLVVAAFATAVLMSRRFELRAAIGRLSLREANLLVVGAALICGCFLAGQSVIYRGIYLLLALPGLLSLSRQAIQPAGRAAFRRASVAIPILLWMPFIEWCVAAAGLGSWPAYPNGAPSESMPDVPFGYAVWFCSELGWWWVFTVLLAILAAFVTGSEAWSALFRRARRRSVALPEGAGADPA